eukprot:224277_1
MELFNLIIILFIRSAHCVYHQTTFNVTHTHDESIAILVNAGHVNTSSGVWHLNPTSQESYDLLLTLDNQWSFDPNITSQISLEMDGYTPDISRLDCEFLIVFSVDNHKYFSVVIRLDASNTLWKYYPASTVLATTNNVYNDIISGNDSQQRWNRVSDNGNWSNILPKYKTPLKWPLFIRITNNPITNRLQYECIVNDAVLRFDYDDAFIGTETKIYIMNDASDGKPFDIHWMKVQYQDNRTLYDNATIPTTTAPLTSEYEMTTTALVPETTETDTQTQAQTTTEMSDVYSTEIEKEPFIYSNVENTSTGVMIGIVIAVVCGVICVVLGIVYYFKQKEEVYSPHDVNRSEYHTPRLDLSNTDIENILEKKRKESTQYSAGFVVDGTQRTQAIMPITSNTSDEEDDIHHRDSDQFIED